MRGVNIPELKINDGIRSKELRVIAPDGVQVGVLELKKALIIAEELNLDLVEISPDSKPPVARLMDYGKYKYELAQKAVNHVRTHQGPYFLELETYRWREHCGPNFDNDLGYRSENEYQEWKQRCPVENFEKLLLDTKIIEKSQVEQMRKTILREFEEAVDFAKSSPFPDSGEIGKNLYKEKDLNPI